MALLKSARRDSYSAAKRSSRRKVSSPAERRSSPVATDCTTVACCWANWPRSVSFAARSRSTACCAETARSSSCSLSIAACLKVSTAAAIWPTSSLRPMAGMATVLSPPAIFFMAVAMATTGAARSWVRSQFIKSETTTAKAAPPRMKAVVRAAAPSRAWVCRVRLARSVCSIWAITLRILVMSATPAPVLKTAIAWSWVAGSPASRMRGSTETLRQVSTPLFSAETSWACSGGRFRAPSLSIALSSNLLAAW